MYLWLNEHTIVFLFSVPIPFPAISISVPFPVPSISPMAVMTTMVRQTHPSRRRSQSAVREDLDAIARQPRSWGFPGLWEFPGVAVGVVAGEEGADGEEVGAGEVGPHGPVSSARLVGVDRR
jgi:hypothetical protein